MTDSIISGLKDITFNPKYIKLKVLFGSIVILMLLGVVLYRGSMANYTNSVSSD